MFGFGLPTYGFGLTLSLPIKNHVAAANLADAAVSKKMDALRAALGEQTVRLQVVNAITNLENSRASVELARTARDLAQKRVDAEQKKYDLGIETIFFRADRADGFDDGGIAGGESDDQLSFEAAGAAAGDGNAAGRAGHRGTVR